MSKKNRYDYNIPPNATSILEEKSKTSPSDDPFHTEHNDGSLSIHTKAEIRKGCIWEIQLKISQKLVNDLDVKKIYVLTNLKKKNAKLDSKAFYVDLKIRSKLIRPIKELPFAKVGVAVNEADPVDVTNSTATMRVKFNSRPRTVFHKHADMMILVVTLMQGEKVVSSTAQELIFRGGTGSVHSADSRKKAILNSKMDSEEMEKGRSKKEAEVNYQGYNEMMVDGNNQGMSMDVKSHMQSFVPVTEYEDFNANVFWHDFYHNKGDRLIPVVENNNQSNIPPNPGNDDMGIIEDTMQFMNPIESEINPTMENEFTHHDFTNNQNIQLSTDNFSIALNGIKNIQNGGYQATIQGNFFNKHLTGTLHFFFDQNEGTFKGSFNGNLNN